MYLVRSTAGVSVLICPCLSESFNFHKKRNSGFCSSSFEIFGSFRTQDDRCASAPVVAQEASPLPNCALQVPAKASRQPPKRAAYRFTLLMLVFLSALNHLAKLNMSLSLGQSLRNGFFSQRSHDVIARLVGVQSITRQILFEVSAINQSRIIVEIHGAALSRIALDGSVQSDNLTLRPSSGLVCVGVGDWSDGREHNPDSICFRQLRHRGQVLTDSGFGCRARETGEVVRSPADHHHFWLQCHHILLKTH